MKITYPPHFRYEGHILDFVEHEDIRLKYKDVHGVVSPFRAHRVHHYSNQKGTHIEFRPFRPADSDGPLMWIRLKEIMQNK